MASSGGRSTSLRLRRRHARPAHRGRTQRTGIGLGRARLGAAPQTPGGRASLRPPGGGPFLTARSAEEWTFAAGVAPQGKRGHRPATPNRVPGDTGRGARADVDLADALYI